MSKLIIALLALTIVNAQQIHNVIYAQTGKFSVTWYNTGHEFETDNSKERTVHFIALFREPFDQVPQMEVGLYGFDLGFNNAGIYAEVDRVAKDGYDIKITCPAGSICYNIAVDFIAYIEGQGYEHTSFSSSDFDEAQQNTWKSGANARYATKTLTSSITEDTGVISFISGFQFGAGANIRLRTATQSVANGEATLELGTWADTKLLSFRIGVLFFKKSEKTDAFSLSSSKTGTLYTGHGFRDDVKKTENIPSQGAQFFVAFSHIDFINGHNYRVKHDHHHGENYLSTTFTTWYDTSIWRVVDAVLYTPIIDHSWAVAM